MATESTTGAACTDCLFLLANGMTPDHMNEVETAEWLAGIEARHPTADISIGGPHDEDCPNLDEGGEWMGTEDCECENLGFSWSSCDVCGSTLGGDRHAVTFWLRSTIS